MSYDILQDFETHRRPITDHDRMILQENADIGFTAAAMLEPWQSYAQALQKHMAYRLKEYRELLITPLAGYAIGLRRGRFAAVDEEGMPWNQISAQVVSDFRKGRAQGSAPFGGTHVPPAEQLLATAIDKFEFTSANDTRASAALLGNVAIIHAMAIRSVPVRS